MILLMILNVLYASMFIFSKYALSTGQPVFMTATRMMIGGVISLAIYSYRSWSWDAIKKISGFDWALIGLLTITNIYFCNAFEYWGLQYLTAGKTAFIYNLGPFFAALLAYFLFAEKMTLYKWIGLILGFVGFLPIFLEPAQSLDTTMTFGPLSLAEIALLIASFATVIGWTTMRLLMNKTHLSLFFLNGLSMVLGSFLCFAHAFLFESTPYIMPGQGIKFLEFACLLAMSQNIIAYNLHAFLLQKYTTTFITFSCFISSVFAAILGVFFLGETISSYFFISMIFVLIGLIIFYQEELRQGYIQK
ncbi:DMT family transporter [Candidatus Babeliales bacterium]|nr:DMT family transporter [Candidatus Babeliales bacterium]MBP9843945.1 DMT family transporter [Candidatus Babeliales bacterium]